LAEAAHTCSISFCPSLKSSDWQSLLVRHVFMHIPTPSLSSVSRYSTQVWLLSGHWLSFRQPALHSSLTPDRHRLERHWAASLQLSTSSFEASEFGRPQYSS